MNERIRIAVVGLKHGTEHLDHYRGRDDVEVVGLCDMDQTLAVEVANKYGASQEAVFSDYSRMLNEVKPDAVFVMTPVPFHASMTVQALEAGAHVFVAKSLCRTLDEGRSMIRARDEAGKEVEVGLQMHYAPVYRYLIDHLDDPEFGELRGAWIQFFYPSYWREEGNWQNRMETLGGMLLDCCIHPMDVLLYVLGRRWVRVFASGRQFLDGPPERNTPDAASVLVDLEGGPRLTIDLVDSRAYCCVRTGVVGSTGKFEVEHWEPDGAGHVRFHASAKSDDPVTIWTPPPEASTGHIGIVEQSMHFLEICKGKAESWSTLESALESLSVQMGIVRSLKEDRWVKREEICTGFE
jgi:predicted dehydrogenase